ncbi:putative MSP (Major sperm protein) domain containing protein [Leishmania utingensis]|uniref:MSP (Major sperm protein) domain containing protein n=1 Tax=Leishmania utingensis TaxID=653362 RepID=A0AAW3AQA3_9TRYP
MELRNSVLNASSPEGLCASPLPSQHCPPSQQQQQRYRSAKTHSKIKIEPNCLVFPPPHFGRCIQNAVSIYNVSKQPCVFKMRSQNPERYVAKPHVAIVAPESATRSFVTLRDMNTLGMKNLPEEMQDRFRFSLRLYDPTTVDPSLSPKDLWSVLAARGDKVDHEQDLIAYFTKRDTPVGGLVTFFPPTYISVIPPAASKTVSSTTSVTSPQTSNSTATHAIDSGVSAVVRGNKSAGAAGNSAKSVCFAVSGGETHWEKGAGAKRGLWIGMVVVAVLALSAAVVMRHLWCTGDAAAGQFQRTAASGRPTPQSYPTQAHGGEPAVSVEPPLNHAEAGQAQQHQQHREGHHNR